MFATNAESNGHFLISDRNVIAGMKPDISTSGLPYNAAYVAVYTKMQH